MVVFSLWRWSSSLPSGFLVPRRTPDTCLHLTDFDYGTFTPFDLPFQVCSSIRSLNFASPYPLHISIKRLGSSDFARHYSRNRSYFLFLRVIRCFSSPGSPRMTIDSSYDTATLLAVSSLIRISATLSSFATPRSFSQLVTSFFGAMYQGILPTLFVAYSFVNFFRFLALSKILQTSSFLFPVYYLYLTFQYLSLSSFLFCLSVLYFQSFTRY